MKVIDWYYGRWYFELKILGVEIDVDLHPDFLFRASHSSDCDTEGFRLSVFTVWRWKKGR